MTHSASLFFFLVAPPLHLLLRLPILRSKLELDELVGRQVWKIKTGGNGDGGMKRGTERGERGRKGRGVWG